ncbi:MAG: hypothetical protein EG824_01990 [Deltaproteobacteria bacterium]|nr:hypothetical protein [Deltaproteobacteria bacterium]
MQRPDTPDGLFHDGNPATGVKGTPITAEWLNALIAVGAFLSGDTEPPAAELGGAGDFYICKTSYKMYGPKDQGTGWPAGYTSIIGPQGVEGLGWLSGSGAPSDANGRDGDYYLRTDTYDVYKKAAGAWGGTIINIKGVTGNPYKAYATLAAANADLANIPADALIWVNADPTAANIGYWAKTGGVLVQSSYDRVALLEQNAAIPNANHEIRNATIPYIVYVHPRGDAEMDGSQDYVNISYIGGFYTQMTERTAFNAIEGRIWCTDPTANIEWRLWKRPSAASFDTTTVTPDDSGTIPAGSFSTTNQLATFRLNKTIVAAANERVFLIFRAANDAKISYRQFTSDPYGDRLGIMLKTSAGWPTSISFGGGTNKKTAARFYLESEEWRVRGYVSATQTSFVPAGTGLESTTVQGAVAELATAAAVARPNAEYEFREGYVPYRSYTPPNGEADMNGELTYTVSYLGGLYLTVAESTVLNAVRGRVWNAGIAADVEWRAFIRTSDASFDTTTVTPDDSGTIPAADFPTVSRLEIFRLNKTLKLATGQTLFLLFIATNGAKIRMPYTALVPGRKGFPFNTTTPGWPATFSFGNTSTYGRALPEFLLESEEMRSRGYGTASDISFDPTGTGLAGQTVQAAIEEVASMTQGTPRILLPDEIPAVVGDTVQLFHRGVLEVPEPRPNQLVATCTIGKAFPRYFEFTPVAEDVGDKTLTMRVLDLAGGEVVAGSTTIKVINPIGQPAALTNVLCFGDSLTSGGAWPKEFFRRLARSGGTPVGLNYGNINFIGNKQDSIDPDQKWVGYGGWTWASYLGEGASAYEVTAVHDKTASDQKSIYQDINGNRWSIETIYAGSIKMMPEDHSNAMPAAPNALTWVSGGVNHSAINYTAISAEARTPFWNPTTDQVSFTQFISDQGETGIDIVYVLLGWNSMTGPNLPNAADHAATIAKGKQLIDVLHSEYPAAQVRLLGLQVPSPNGGLATNYGATGTYAHFYELLRTVNGYNLALQAWADDPAYSSFVRYLAVAPQFDSDNNMPQADAAVNTRNALTEKRGTNGVHPDTPGYYQIADVAFRDFIRTYCS